ncbi:MAG: hypothetical protein ACOH2K_15585 [Burkholderiaceae bacterium]
MHQDTFNACDTLIKVISVIALFVSGLFAMSQYKEGQEREYKKVFYEKQIAVIANVFDVLTEIDTANSKDDEKKAVKKFWMLYHGIGRAFLSSNMFESLNGLPLDYVRGCVAKISKPKIIADCSNFSASQSAAGFGKIAREEISKSWSQDFSKIGEEDPWLLKKLQQSN